MNYLEELSHLVNNSGNCVNLGRNLKATQTAIYDLILDKTTFLNTKKRKVTFNERVFCVLNNINKIVLNYDNTEARFMNLFKGYCIKEKNQLKRKITCLKKYGVDNPGKYEAFKNKAKKTKLERYGNENFTNPEKAKNTSIERYSAEHYTQSKYNSGVLDNLTNKQWLMEQHYELKKSITMIAQELKVDHTTVTNYLTRAGIKIKYYNQSNPEKMLCEYLHKSFQTVILQNVRTIIPPREIDIWIPAFRLGIEYNGRYWHRPEKFNSKEQWFDYHQSKIDLCNEKGINLLHLWEGYGNHEDLIKDALFNNTIDNNLNDVYKELYEN